MARDIFKAPFDEGTQSKLKIYKEYVKEWLPTFTKKKEVFWSDIFVYDFFSGEGMDKDGNFGSPLILLEELVNHHDVIKEKKLKINVLLNEKDKSKYEKLKTNVEPFKEKAPYQITITNRDFKALFEELYLEMVRTSNLPRLIFIDQYGIKEVPEEIFQKLTNLQRTDFMFFISSSSLKRFGESEEFKEYTNITKSQFDQSRPFECHRIVFNYYRSLVEDPKYFMAPFSIKKRQNIYGLIFGTHNPLGIEKFLKVSWGLNQVSGDANFFIDEEDFFVKRQISMFENDNKPKKLTLFKKNLEQRLLKKELRTNSEVYEFTFNEGCLPKHANVVLKDLIKRGRIAKVTTVNQKIHKLEPESIQLLQ